MLPARAPTKQPAPNAPVDRDEPPHHALQDTAASAQSSPTNQPVKSDATNQPADPEQVNEARAPQCSLTVMHIDEPGSHLTQRLVPEQWRQSAGS